MRRVTMRAKELLAGQRIAVEGTPGWRKVERIDSSHAFKVHLEGERDAHALMAVFSHNGRKDWVLLHPEMPIDVYL